MPMILVKKNPRGKVLMVKRNMYCRISLSQQGLLTERRPEWSSKRWDMKTVITARENPGSIQA